MLHGFGVLRFGSCFLDLYASYIKLLSMKTPWWRGKKQLNSHQSSVAKVSFVSIFANFSDLHSKILHISYDFLKVMFHQNVSQNVQHELVSSIEVSSLLYAFVSSNCALRKSGKNRPGPKMRLQLLSQPEVIALNAFINAIKTFGQSCKVM